jgi:hypothetical protein
VDFVLKIVDKKCSVIVRRRHYKARRFPVLVSFVDFVLTLVDRQCSVTVFVWTRNAARQRDAVITANKVFSLRALGDQMKRPSIAQAS